MQRMKQFCMDEYPIMSYSNSCQFAMLCHLTDRHYYYYHYYIIKGQLVSRVNGLSAITTDRQDGMAYFYISMSLWSFLRNHIRDHAIMLPFV